MTSQPAMCCVDCQKLHPPRAALLPSPFQSFITDERLPTPSEKAAIRDFVQNTDAEIEWRERTVDRLLCELAELRRRSEHHKAIIAPIRRVPPEIMAEIFLQLTATEARATIDSGLYESYPYDDFDVDNLLGQNDKVRPVIHTAPLIFGEISRHWRAIALSTPRLWNSIFLNCKDDKVRDNIALCDTWLKRSGSLPLSIRFRRPYHSTGGPAPRAFHEWQDLIMTILPYARRWRLLDLDDVPLASSDVFCGLSDSLPVLEALSIDCGSAVKLSSGLCARLRSAPKLRLFHFTSIGTSVNEWQTLPWSQLTHIDVGGCSAYDCLYILSVAATAVACRFSIERDSTSEHPPVSHSALQTLKIYGYRILELIWNNLTCPRLSTLEIETGSSFHDIPSFLARSGAVIQNFALSGCNMDDTRFTACLRTMPGLRRLNISEDGACAQFTDLVWESLTWTADSPPLLPNLESLRLVGGYGFSHKAAVRMLESRAQSRAGFVPKLKTITLSIWRKMSGSACRRLTALTKFGLHIDLDTMFEEDDESGSEASDAEN
ncbi:hypothetical protein MSAN_01269000 [Mycena sanguinolenta]|uniref:F-box domain-containing protein n=1 Tax=Mycena sanguinolenta TaxID=230812 RepID=A0A8H6YHL8_9AGAR|nr:hypothetical protein MSAN_01269000 [Mycena sanguinolenta]